MNDLTPDMNLSKDGSELFASRVKEKNLRNSGTKVSFYQRREHELMVYFTESLVKTEKFVYSHNVKGLLIHMGLANYDHSDCRLFIYNSKRSLKCVLLHNSNEYASV